MTGVTIVLGGLSAFIDDVITRAVVANQKRRADEANVLVATEPDPTEQGGVAGDTGDDRGGGEAEAGAGVAGEAEDGVAGEADGEDQGLGEDLGGPSAGAGSKPHRAEEGAAGQGASRGRAGRAKSTVSQVGGGKQKRGGAHAFKRMGNRVRRSVGLNAGRAAKKSESLLARIIHSELLVASAYLVAAMAVGIVFTTSVTDVTATDDDDGGGGGSAPSNGTGTGTGRRTDTFGFVESLYWVVITGTTVGFGDKSAQTHDSRWFFVFYLFFIVVAMGNFLTVLQALLLDTVLSYDITTAKVTLTDDLIRTLDTTGDGKVSRVEWLQAMLLTLGAVDEKLLHVINEQFNTLNITHGDFLSADDLEKVLHMGRQDQLDFSAMARVDLEQAQRRLVREHAPTVPLADLPASPFHTKTTFSEHAEHQHLPRASNQGGVAEEASMTPSHLQRTFSWSTSWPPLLEPDEDALADGAQPTAARPSTATAPDVFVTQHTSRGTGSFPTGNPFTAAPVPVPVSGVAPPPRTQHGGAHRAADASGPNPTVQVLDFCSIPGMGAEARAHTTSNV